MDFRALALCIAAAAVCVAPAVAQTVRPKANPALQDASMPGADGVASMVAGLVSERLANPVADDDMIGPPTLAAIDPVAARRSAAPPRDPNKGAVTNLPLPRFVSLKSGEGNARRGPGLTHRIDWRFTRSGMPLKITAEHEHWRRIEDAEGMGGWVHFALLSGVRSALVSADKTQFHMRPDQDAPVVFAAEAGVVGRILSCAADWCRLDVGTEKGWARVSDLWGIDPGETID